MAGQPRSKVAARVTTAAGGAAWTGAPGAATAPLPEAYRPRQPQKTLLYKVVEENLGRFLAQAQERNPDGPGLPGFVRREFEEYLSCGIASRGFCRLLCPECGHERVVAFSCKGRGFCPSCGARRMHDLSAHLCDRILPVLPYRHFVLSFPHQLRVRLAYEREFFAAARRIFVAAIFSWQRKAARKLGVQEPLCGAVSFAQRGSSDLVVNPHLRAIVADGVFFEGKDGRVLFRPLPRPTLEDVEAITRRLVRRTLSWLERREPVDEPQDALAETYTSALNRPSARTAGAPAHTEDKLCAVVDGFSLEAGRRVHEHDRDGLARLVRYGARPPLALSRLSQGEDGKLLYRLKKPFKDGTCTITLAPMELLRRLAALVPPPRIPLTQYHGVFAAHSKHRPLVVPAPVAPEAELADASAPPSLFERALEPPAELDPDLFPPFPAPEPRERYLDWATLLRRSQGLDGLLCEKCGGRMQVLAYVTDPALAAELWEEISRPKARPARRPARAPP